MTDDAQGSHHGLRASGGQLLRRPTPLMEGVNREDVTVEADGTHSGPPRFRETEKAYTGNAGMTHYLLAMYCPCGHLVRYVGEYGKADRVTCEGVLP